MKKSKKKKTNTRSKLKEARELVSFYEDFMHEIISGKCSIDSRAVAIQMDILKQDIEHMKVDIAFYKSELQKYESEKEISQGLKKWRKSSIMLERLSGILK